MNRCCILFDNLGPYHVARLNAAAQMVDLVAIQGGVSSSTYAWKSTDGFGFSCVSLNPDGPTEAMGRSELVKRLNQALDDAAPRVIFVPGWASLLALASMKWAIRRGVPIAVMSESTPWDERRVWWKEAIKRRILRNASAALVGGTPHRDYLIKLGMNPVSIFDGYDVVDNDYFARASDEIRRKDKQSLLAYHDFFLASNRFVEKKNLFRLVDAYSVHCERVENPWALCLLGDGPLKEALIKHCQSHDLDIAMSAPWENKPRITGKAEQRGIVYFPGFRQIEDLPTFYARARVFVHASTTEQWGLVVNEAMASGLPVIVSNRCGCAPDLVVDGVTGWVFDPENVSDLAALLDIANRIDLSEFQTLVFGIQAKINEWSPKRFAESVSQISCMQHLESNLSTQCLDRIVLSLMSRFAS